MAKPNLDKMSVKDLKQLQKDVDKAIKAAEDRSRKDALTALEETAKKHGFSLSDLTGAMPKKRKSSPATPKYAHPENAELTWSGRGRQPVWFKEALENGKTPDDLAIA